MIIPFMPRPDNVIPMEEIDCQATIAFKARKTAALAKITPTYSSFTSFCHFIDIFG